MNKNRRLIQIAVMFLLPFTSGGCVYTKYTGKGGVSMTRVSLFGNQTVGKVDLENGTISGYQSEQTEAAAAMVSAAVGAALKK